METFDILPGVFSSDFVITDIEADKLLPTVAMMRRQQILPQTLVAPAFVLWDLTYRCNLCCKHCYNGSSPKGVGEELSRDELFRVADELIGMKVFSICLSGGEPKQYPWFLDLARYLRDHGIAVSTITNGTDLSDEVIHTFASTMALVQVSLEGPNAKIHDALRGRGAFDRTLDHIRRMREAGVHQIRISCVATRETIEEMPALLDLCLELGVDDLRSMPVVPLGRAHDRDLEPTPEQCDRARDRIHGWMKDPEIASRITVEWGDPTQHIKLGLVYGFVLGANITADGYYRFTPYLNLAMGNVRTMSLREAWMRGLGVAWTHPLVAEELARIDTPGDLARVFDGRTLVGHGACLDLLAEPLPEIAHQPLEEVYS